MNNPGQPAPPPLHDRQEMTVLDEPILLHSFRLTPTLAVWTVSGHPIGVLMPEGELWRRGCLSDSDSLQNCLEAMVRDFRADQAVTRV